MRDRVVGERAVEHKAPSLIQRGPEEFVIAAAYRRIRIWGLVELMGVAVRDQHATAGAGVVQGLHQSGAIAKFKGERPAAIEPAPGIAIAVVDGHGERRAFGVEQIRQAANPRGIRFRSDVLDPHEGAMTFRRGGRQNPEQQVGENQIAVVFVGVCERRLDQVRQIAGLHRPGCPCCAGRQGPGEDLRLLRFEDHGLVDDRPVALITRESLSFVFDRHVGSGPALRGAPAYLAREIGSAEQLPDSVLYPDDRFCGLSHIREQRLWRWGAAEGRQNKDGGEGMVISGAISVQVADLGAPEAT